MNEKEIAAVKALKLELRSISVLLVLVVNPEHPARSYLEKVVSFLHDAADRELEKLG